MTRTVKINRAPVLTLWAAVVAQRLGFDWKEALTLGRAVAGLNAYSKGVSLGLFALAPKSVREQKKKAKVGVTLHVDLLHRAVPVKRTREGLRATTKGRPVSPESVARYLEDKFGVSLSAVTKSMKRFARSMPPKTLAANAYKLYEKFRPGVPAGTRGWGAAGTLDLAGISKLARGGLKPTS